ncbi:metal cation transporter, ZIP family protein (macronuclear) [Tetrahymena thermophila SB210]|uniref:Metal cation transporter, ZIP family protein n=1 Tax=Tetrahymena thermophila (strain SB210) TaxID=312017 RepID=I7MMQ7_TETTS|nr:metal cation transporter, ZIP family protein [Tetrahymena thermophila SB210]EAS06217.1 metal cation transporter, ZIP family protein [Tetrahymena thermophila SB210]|eukprot:XP_001026462.1 metal cation transporter, ZIP family protein [Tetrahymena thermophila SB210]
MPLRVKSFRENQKVLSIASAFSGGLFLSVGLIHILPEAAENFDNYLNQTQHFPFQMLITVASFSFLLLLDRVIGGQFHGIHHHNEEDNEHDEVQEKKHHNGNEYYHNNSCNDDSTISHAIYHDYNNIQNVVKYSQKQYARVENQDCQNKIKNDQIQNQFSINGIEEDQNFQEIENQKAIKKVIEDTENKEHHLINSSKTNYSLQNSISGCQQKRYSHCQDDLFSKDIHLLENSIVKLEVSKQDSQISNYFAPFVLQVALGIHACLEGLAIGVEQKFSRCLTIALAVLAHKWAEGLVLGLAFKQSNMKIKQASIMIAIQAAMNPIGIALGWILSGAGNLVCGILMSISAGTFIYISTQEVIAEEFSKNRYQVTKYLFYLLGVGFISSLYFIEQATED